MAFDQVTQERIIKEVVKRLQTLEEEPYVPIGVSNRHIHLCQKDLTLLFGEGFQLTPMKDLRQPGQFAANETLTLIGTKGEITGVRILGPLRDHTQVEISRTDCFKLGTVAPVRESGKVTGTPGIILKGPRGTVELKEGVIVAHRHIHVPPGFAEKFKLNDQDRVEVEVGRERKTVYSNVLIRVSAQYELEMHVDTDEANAAGVKTGDLGKIRKGQED
ncbi:phosphate propanoyltransferase [Pseudobacillus sp. FSL P4-0506]|uniref:phosphate propanoyltransferase n=1 Tax=unclassified Pseudobacillus TaxID=2619284 RepID=UPI0030F5DE43